ncbi:uncharacterized protein LOC123545344 [Mercenaria mercenaria]|uniref:uncharacterized protein LOC123545344 n=1 Tax=Mercenaria mercenaria TaxID=6596 RepID=UPI00234F7CD1|nr:uncharacterized protein LOC123545344 [Mercenaria mercenaria]
MTDVDLSERNEDIESDSETRCQSCLRVFIKCLRRFIAFLFSHVGLTCLVVGYAILGGILFKAVELPEEKLIRQDAVNAKDAYVKKIAELFDDSDIQRMLDQKAVNDRINGLLKEYQDEIYVLTEDRDWDGRFEGDEFQWSFAESLLYSVTVISTIGYGNITPKTKGGRLLTIVYGIGGIPLTMLCLHNLGNLLAGCFRLIYRHACINMTYQYIKLKRRRIKKRFVKRLQGKTKHLREWARKQQSHMSSILHHSHTEVNVTEEEDHVIKETDKQAGQFTASDPFPKKNTGVSNTSDSEFHRKLSRRHSESILKDSGGTTRDRTYSLSSHHQYGALHAHHPLSNDLTVIPEDEIAEVTIEDMEHHRIKRSKSVDIDDHVGSTTTSSLSLTDFEEDERLLKAKLKETRDLVPISVCLLLVTGYIMLGALIFASWEETWNFMVAFYFCFITLTTIGFGDFVPGMGRLDDDMKRVFGALYLLFGMALLAMSFHLIQEEVRYKCRKLAVKIGLIEHKLTDLLDKYDETHP